MSLNLTMDTLAFDFTKSLGHDRELTISTANTVLQQDTHNGFQWYCGSEIVFRLGRLTVTFTPSDWKQRLDRLCPQGAIHAL